MSLIARFRRSAPVLQSAPVVERFVVAVADRMIAVRVLRHARARRLRLRYDAVVGELRLTMPPRHTIGRARAWVEDQSPWIEQQIAQASAVIIVAPGALLPWGEGEALAIDWAADAPRTPRLVAGRLQLGGPVDAVGPRVRRWLIARARTEFADATSALAEQARADHGARILTGVSVGDPRSRWGSCSAAGQIRYSWRLAMAPTVVRRAIVAHEVAHLAHMHHGPEFYAVVEALVGADHDASRAWLKRHGAVLHQLRFTA